MFSTSSARWGRRLHPSWSASASHHPPERGESKHPSMVKPQDGCVRGLGVHNRAALLRGSERGQPGTYVGFLTFHGPCKYVSLGFLLGKLLQPMTFELPIFLQLGGQLCTPQQYPKVDQDCPAFWKTAWWHWLAEDRSTPRYVPGGRHRHSQNLVYEHSQQLHS